MIKDKRAIKFQRHICTLKLHCKRLKIWHKFSLNSTPNKLYKPLSTTGGSRILWNHWRQPFLQRDMYLTMQHYRRSYKKLPSSNNNWHKTAWKNHTYNMQLMHINEIYNCCLSSLNNQRHNLQIQVIHFWEAAATKPGPCREKIWRKLWRKNIIVQWAISKKFLQNVLSLSQNFHFFTSTPGGKKKTALPAIIAEENLPKMKIPKKVQTIPKHIYLEIDIIWTPTNPESHNKDSNSSVVRLKWSHLARAN